MNVGTDQPHIPQRGTITLIRYNGVKYRYRMGKNVRKDRGMLPDIRKNNPTAMIDNRSLEWGKTKKCVPCSDNRK